MSREATQFALGQSGNPKGGPKGSRNKLGEDFVSALHQDFTKHGAAAIQTMRETDPSGYVRVIESAGDINKAVVSVISAMGEGTITPSEAGTMTSVLETQRRTIETLELERRLAALEEAVNANTG